MVQNVRPHHRRIEHSTLPSKKPQITERLSFKEKILRIFCCCCFKKQPEQSAVRDELLTLGYKEEGRGSRQHFVIHSSSSTESLVEETETIKELLYNKLNTQDYVEVENVITTHSTLSPTMQAQLLKILEEMKKEHVFLDPSILSARIKGLPFEALDEIRLHTSLACINDAGKQLASVHFFPSDSLKNLKTALNICYNIPGAKKFHEHVGRNPITLDERAEYIRWGALHKYDVSHMPESIKLALNTEEQEEEHKDFITEKRSPSSQIRSHIEILSPKSKEETEEPSSKSEKSPDELSPKTPIGLNFRRDLSLDTFSGEGVDLENQFQKTATDLERLK